uniref:Putative secreted protein n=1 Tax=Amblyomma americanum TaxID=6943 RepID=A0A0C9RWC9_AMBAM
MWNLRVYQSLRIWLQLPQIMCIPTTPTHRVLNRGSQYVHPETCFGRCIQLGSSIDGNFFLLMYDAVDSSGFSISTTAIDASGGIAGAFLPAFRQEAHFTAGYVGGTWPAYHLFAD